jgi:hypothetical protein
MMPTIESLGNCLFLSPLLQRDSGAASFKVDSDRIFYDDRSKDDVVADTSRPLALTFEVAGPRKQTYFDPVKTTAAIMTCGGLCFVSRLERRDSGYRDGTLARIPRNGNRRDPLWLRGIGTKARHQPLTLRPDAAAL